MLILIFLSKLPNYTKILIYPTFSVNKLFSPEFDYFQCIDLFLHDYRCNNLKRRKLEQALNAEVLELFLLANFPFATFQQLLEQEFASLL